MGWSAMKNKDSKDMLERLKYDSKKMWEQIEDAVSFPCHLILICHQRMENKNKELDKLDICIWFQI